MSAPEPPLRVLIADDEPLARQRLQDLLTAEAGVEVVGTAENGREAVEAIRTLQPDLVFLDVQMPGLTGTDVVREIGPAAMPATIFVTAYDGFALRAFELAALDYLLKPFDDERWEQAFARARRTVRLHRVGEMTDRLVALLQGGAPAPERPTAAMPGPQYLQRIAVEMRGQVRVVPTERIDYVTASGPYAEITTEGKKFMLRERMQNLEEQLDPARFFRIHRSVIVRLELVEAIQRSGGGDYAVRLRDGTRLRVSRSRKEALEARLGIPSSA